MHIQHIRRGKNNHLKGTLVAIKDESLHAVRVGFSMVMKGDTPLKFRGIEIAEGRAFKSKDNRVPNGIHREFTDFINRIQSFRQFQGYHIPKVEDFQFTEEKLSDHSNH